jgi:hypothetical protein
MEDEGEVLILMRTTVYTFSGPVDRMESAQLDHDTRFV